MLISDLILKGKSRWEEVYDPSRKPVKAAGTFLSENLTTAKNFAEYVAPGELSSYDEFKPGQGAIVRKGLSKVAAYRDEKGKLFLRSAACSHLGCHLHWNSFERCWDCPCHGSQFAPDGTAAQRACLFRARGSQGVAPYPHKSAVASWRKAAWHLGSRHGFRIVHAQQGQCLTL